MTSHVDLKKSAGEPAVMVHVSMTRGHRAAMKRAARRAGLTLTAWIRSRALEAQAREDAAAAQRGEP